MKFRFHATQTWPALLSGLTLLFVPACHSEHKRTASPDQEEVKNAAPAVLPAVDRNPELASLAELLAEPIGPVGQNWTAPTSDYQTECARNAQLIQKLNRFHTANPKLLALAQGAAGLAATGSSRLDEIARIEGYTPTNWEALTSGGNLLFKPKSDENASFLAKIQESADTIGDLVKVGTWAKAQYDKNAQIKDYALARRRLYLAGCSLGAASQELLTDRPPALGGIGVSFAPDKQGLRISGVQPDSPASGAGLEAGSLLTRVNGHSLAGLTSVAAVNLMRGPLASSARLETTDKNGAARSLRLKRDYAIPAEEIIGSHFYWNWHGAMPQDFMVLANESGQSLHDCCLVVKVYPDTTGQGAATHHFHFVREWRAAETLRAAYHEGGDYLPKLSADEARRVDITLACREFLLQRTEKYDEESEADIGGYLKDLKWNASYQDASDGLFGIGSHPRGISLSFAGLRTLYPDKIWVTFYYPDSSDDARVYWQMDDSWGGDDFFPSKTFYSEHFRRRPRSFEIQVSFKGTAQKSSAAFQLAP